ncbi:MAG: hypothetical protein R3F51_16435 [Cyanobacteriota/Melainabacteria group bacterium]
MSTATRTISNRLKPDPVQQAPAKRPFRFLLELSVTAIVVIFALETIFAWAGVGEQECLKIDPALGFNLFSNKNVTWRKEGFSRVSFNSSGMQDREYATVKPPGTTRIAIIGDSYVEALQVPRENNFCSLLEKRLKLKSDSRFSDNNIQVMNFGVQAHNLSQTYLNLKSKVLAFQPDLVILPVRPEATFLLPPDLKSGFLGARPNFFVGADGELIEDRTVQDLWLKTRAAKRMEATGWLRKNSRIWRTVSLAAESGSGWLKNGGLLKNFLNPVEQELPGLQGSDTVNGKADSDPVPTWVNTTEEGEKSIQFIWPIANALITEMNRLCRQNSCQMLIVRLPGVDGHTSNLETKLLRQTADKNQTAVVDLTEEFHQAIKSSKEKLFYSTHLTPPGHEIVANRLFEKLKQSDLLSRR